MPSGARGIAPVSYTHLDVYKRQIQNHIERDVRRTEIAEEFYLNPDYLSRLFKKEMGVQLKDFIVAEKMKVAQNLLRTTALPVSMVAAKVGYTNFSHFSQVYKKIDVYKRQGATPSPFPALAGTKRGRLLFNGPLQ